MTPALDTARAILRDRGDHSDDVIIAAAEMVMKASGLEDHEYTRAEALHRAAHMRRRERMEAELIVAIERAKVAAPPPYSRNVGLVRQLIVGTPVFVAVAYAGLSLVMGVA